jgi:hypothetical protein
MAFMRFLKILFGGGIDASSEELLAMLVGQTYPGNDFVGAYVSAKGLVMKEEAVFVSAAACCSLGVIGATSEFKSLFTDSDREKLHLSLIRRWSEMYRETHPHASSTEILRKSILDAFGAILRAARNNRNKEGAASGYHAAKQARLLIDPDESTLEEGEIAGFEILISKKKETAIGFFETLRRNKRL